MKGNKSYQVMIMMYLSFVGIASYCRHLFWRVKRRERRVHFHRLGVDVTQRRRRRVVASVRHDLCDGPRFDHPLGPRQRSSPGGTVAGTVHRVVNDDVGWVAAVDVAVVKTPHHAVPADRSARHRCSGIALLIPCIRRQWGHRLRHRQRRRRRR